MATAFVVGVVLFMHGPSFGTPRPVSRSVDERIEAEGVRTRDERLHALDVLVLATGFRVDRFVRPIEVRGREGVLLDEVWKDASFAYLAISVPAFPNFFMLNGPNGGDAGATAYRFRAALSRHRPEWTREGGNWSTPFLGLSSARSQPTSKEPVRWTTDRTSGAGFRIPAHLLPPAGDGP